MAFLPSLNQFRFVHLGGLTTRKVYTFMTALSTVLIGLGTSGFTELHFTADTYIKYNATGGPTASPCLEFWIDGVLEGQWDSSGPQAEGV